MFPLLFGVILAAKASQERPKRLPKPVKCSPKLEKTKGKKQLVFKVFFLIDFISFFDEFLSDFWKPKIAQIAEKHFCENTKSIK